MLLAKDDLWNLGLRSLLCQTKVPLCDATGVTRSLTGGQLRLENSRVADLSTLLRATYLCCHFKPWHRPHCILIRLPYADYSLPFSVTAHALLDLMNDSDDA
jgi:hypothetical protein